MTRILAIFNEKQTTERVHAFSLLKRDVSELYFEVELSLAN